MTQNRCSILNHRPRNRNFRTTPNCPRILNRHFHSTSLSRRWKSQSFPTNPTRSLFFRLNPNPSCRRASRFRMSHRLTSGQPIRCCRLFHGRCAHRHSFAPRGCHCRHPTSGVRARDRRFRHRFPRRLRCGVHGHGQHFRRHRWVHHHHSRRVRCRRRQTPLKAVRKWESVFVRRRRRGWSEAKRTEEMT